MPTNITIRDIPDEVYAKIKKQADLHHRSINSEVIVCLKKLVQSNKRNPEQVISRAKKLKQKAKGTLSMDEIQQTIDSPHKSNKSGMTSEKPSLAVLNSNQI